MKLKRQRTKTGSLYYTACDGKYRIRRVKNELGGGFYYCVTNTETGNLVRGNTDRLDDVRARLDEIEGK